MIFNTKEYEIDFINEKDLQEVVEVYNSNTNFLINHMDTDKVTYDWIREEFDTMKKEDFYSCKMIEKKTGKIIGVIDYKIGNETYLSLMMIHNNYKNSGIGKSIYHAFEEYIKLEKSECIRIDVVASYDESVIQFWLNNGFEKYGEIELNWTGKVLPAIRMKKFINN